VQWGPKVRYAGCLKTSRVRVGYFVLGEHGSRGEHAGGEGGGRGDSAQRERGAEERLAEERASL
jgi:hypothetical protein